jgi:hypothetical protein
MAKQWGPPTTPIRPAVSSNDELIKGLWRNDHDCLFSESIMCLCTKINDLSQVNQLPHDE